MLQLQDLAPRLSFAENHGWRRVDAAPSVDKVPLVRGPAPGMRSVAGREDLEPRAVKVDAGQVSVVERLT